VSSDALDTDVDLDAIVDRTFIGDVGIPWGAELLAFATAVHDTDTDLEAARNDLAAAVGIDGLIEAAATVSVFNGLVRVADGTGIQLDEGLQTFTHDDRSRLGLDKYAGAVNTTGTGRGEHIDTISEMFG
jgi:hypothetical protein